MCLGYRSSADNVGLGIMRTHLSNSSEVRIVVDSTKLPLCLLRHSCQNDKEDTLVEKHCNN